MNQLRLTVILFFCFCSLAIGQEKSFPEQWMECVYAGYDDQGEAIRKMLLDFELELIDKGLLIDNTPVSYRALLDSLQNPSFVVDSTLNTIGNRIVLLEDSVDNKAINACHEELDKQSENFNSKEVEEVLRKVMMSDQPNLASYAQALDNTYKDAYFKYDYYKLFLFLGFELEELLAPKIETDFNMSQEDIERMTDQLEDVLEEQYNVVPENSFVVMVPETNKIIFDYQPSNLRTLQKEAKSYMGQAMEYAATFIIKYTKDCSPEFIKEVEAAIREGIDQARDAYAKKHHRQAFNKLDNDTQLEIVTMFPNYITLQLIK